CVRLASTCKSNWFSPESFWREVRRSKTALRPLPGIRGGSRGGKPANRAECTFSHKRSDKRSCKGAFGKTSGRSIFPNAPLRATSSATGGACRMPFLTSCQHAYIERGGG